MKELCKKRLYAVIAVIVCLPLSIVGAASQNLIMGSFFGFILALGIDYLLSSYKADIKEQ